MSRSYAATAVVAGVALAACLALLDPGEAPAPSAEADIPSGTTLDDAVLTRPSSEAGVSIASETGSAPAGRVLASMQAVSEACALAARSPACQAAQDELFGAMPASRRSFVAGDPGPTNAEVFTRIPEKLAEVRSGFGAPECSPPAGAFYPTASATTCPGRSLTELAIARSICSAGRMDSAMQRELLRHRALAAQTQV